MIPKILHYVWIGPNKPGRIQRQCIESWERYLPEWEVKLWNEDNNPYMNQWFVQKMYQDKLWAFASDYLRFRALYQYGGVAIGADMEVLRSINPLLNHKMFLAKSPADGFLSTGIIGAEPKHKLIKEIINIYDTDFNLSIKDTAPKVLTRAYNQINPAESEMSILDSELFYPCLAGELCNKQRLINAYTNNHWAESWRRFRTIRKVVRIFLRRTHSYDFVMRLYRRFR